MRIYSFLLFFVGCCGVEWKAVNEFKDTFKEFSVALNAISSIENILNTSTIDSEQFLNKTFSDNPLWNRIAKMRLLNSRNESYDPCHDRIIDEQKFKLSYQIQMYQIQVPLRSRAVDIRERLNNVSSSLDIYQGLAESKYLSCRMSKGKCLEETNEWLESTIGSLSCVIYPNCSKHFVRKRSNCSPGQFRCNNGACISGSNYCNGACDCDACNDEPHGCTKSCSEFRCNFTFRCVPLYKKCNRINDCGDWSDEEGCSLTDMQPHPQVNCSIDAGFFLCYNNKCIALGQVCDGYNNCGDWSDEGDHCNGQKCSSQCIKKGGICFTEPKGSKCLYECPPGTYETLKGCSRYPEAPLPTLIQILEDTPRLVTRFASRLKFLKIKTILAISQSLQDLVNCKKNEFSLLSKMIDFSTIIHEEEQQAIPEPVINRTLKASETTSGSKDNKKQPIRT